MCHSSTPAVSGCLTHEYTVISDDSFYPRDAMLALPPGHVTSRYCTETEGRIKLVLVRVRVASFDLSYSVLKENLAISKITVIPSETFCQILDDV